MIDQATVQRIFDAAEITEVVSDFVTLRKRGVNYLGLCPFHNEKTPSFTVSPSKGIYKCFGCGKGGNAVNFIMEHEHQDYVGALKYLANKYKIEVAERELTPAQVQEKNDRESMMIVNGYALKYFSQVLLENPQGKAVGYSYLRQRGFRDDIIEKFQLGFCTDEWDAFSRSAQDNGYKSKYLVKTGLSLERENRLLDRFRGRVIFPIHGIAGRVLGFGGRVLKKDAKTAKYLNSPESDVYHKSRVLYGIFHAKRSIVQNDKCFLVEGYTDVISMHQAGIENVVASSGTALTPDQIRLVKRFSNNITIIYDGDAAGIKASLRGIDLVLEQGLNVKVLLLPDGEDPDSFSRSMSSTDLMNYIQQHETDFIAFKTNLLLDDANDDPVKKANLIIDIVRSIAIIPDAIVRSVYVRECSSILNVDERVLYNEINKIIHKRNEDEFRRRKSAPEEATTGEKMSESSGFLRSANVCDLEERALIRLLLIFDKEVVFEQDDDQGNVEQITVGNFIISELQRDELESINPVYQKIIQEYGERFTEQDFEARIYFRDHSNSKISQLACDILSEPYHLSQLWTRNESVVETEEMKLKELVPKLVNEYKVKKVQLMMKEVQQQIQKAQEEKNYDVLMDLMKRKMVIDQVKQALSRELGNRIIL